MWRRKNVERLITEKNLTTERVKFIHYSLFAVYFSYTYIFEIIFF
jgi:hypothetical protein